MYKRKSQKAKLIISTSLVLDLEKTHKLYSEVDGYISLSTKKTLIHRCRGFAAGLPVILSPGNDLAGDLNEGMGWLLKTEEKIEVIKALRSLTKYQRID